MAQMPWGWGKPFLQSRKSAGGLERCQDRMTPSWAPDHALRPPGQAGVEPLRGIHRGYPRNTLGPLLSLAAWFRGQAGPEGLRVCVMLSAQSPLLLSLWSRCQDLPLDPIPFGEAWSGVGPMRRDASGQGWLGWQAGASVGGRGGACVSPLRRAQLFGFPFGDRCSPALLLLPCFLHGPNVPESAASGRHSLSLSLGPTCPASWFQL